MFEWTGYATSFKAIRELRVVAVFALVLIALRRFDDSLMSTWIGKGLSGLGLISYSLYLIHQFNMTFVERIVGKVALLRDFKGAQIAAMLLLHTALATVFWFFCERPFLNQKRKSARAPTCEPLTAVPA